MIAFKPFNWSQIITFILICAPYGNSSPFVGELTGKVTELARNATDFVIQPIDDLYQVPISVILSTLTTLCAAHTDLDIVPLGPFAHIRKLVGSKPKNLDEDLKIVLITNDNVTVEASLLQARDLVENPKFDKGKKMVVFVTGFTTSFDKTEEYYEDDQIMTMYNAFKCRGNYNFMTLDPAKYIDTFYTWSAFNTQKIGKNLGRALANIVLLSNYPKENIHLIGHSLGAHIVGVAGKMFMNLTGEQIPRITGLDPARPCFERNSVLNRLTPESAKFVDVIHTDTGMLGTAIKLGDIDFFPNKNENTQPGCLNIKSIGCSHNRAIEYFAESVYPLHSNNFLATLCQDSNSSMVPMGFDTWNSAYGVYCLNTNSERPYGKNAKLRDYRSQCAVL